MSQSKVVLAFSGGLDTSFCVKYLSEDRGMDVHSVLVDTGGFSDAELKAIEERAYSLGVKSHVTISKTDDYYGQCLKYLIFGNVLKNNTYPLCVSAERIFQAIAAAEYAQQIGASAIAHGSTGAGNDQVRFDMAFRIISPDAEIITPIRDLKLSREAEIEYLKDKGVEQEWHKAAYSINKGLWGTSVGGKETLTSNQFLPESAWPTQVTKSEPEEVTLTFEQGEIKAIGDETFTNPVDAIRKLTELAGPFGIGRDIHVGDTIIGIKGRVGFEAPAPLILLKAHHTLEKHVLAKWQLYWKDQLANWYGTMLHEGQFMDPVMRNIEAFLADTQAHVSGKVHVLLAPYRFQVQGIESEHDLMAPVFGSYGEMNNAWTGDDVRGFSRVASNQVMIYEKFVNVILDASPLGIGFYHRQARTGISRVIEQLLTGLSHAEDVTLTLAAPTHLPETMRYAAQTLGPAAPPFVNSPGEQTVARLENALLRPFAPASLPTKAIRRLTDQARRTLKREHARFDLDRLPSPAVYHATFFAAPDAIRQRRTATLLQSVYDMIPVVHPEWFTDGEQTVKQVLATLPPDAWVTTISQATKDDFCNYTGFDPARVVPILLAASPELFYPVTDLSRQRAVQQRLGVGDAPYLLSIATLEPRKNIAHLIRCFGQLIESQQLPADVRLVLVGTKGWKFDEIMAEAGRSEALRSRLVFTGFVPDEDLAPLYSGAIAFVYPSLYEGFGLPPLEAMQCGLPVITSNVSSLPEVVGDAALLVPPTDADALAQAILTVVNTPAIRAKLAAKAVERATLFSWDKFIAQHVALYGRILGV